MEKIKENLSYIIKDEDTDKDKFEKILKKMGEHDINLMCSKYTITEVKEGFCIGNVFMKIKEEEIDLPFILEAHMFNSNINSIIRNMKKFIVFEKLGILHEIESKEVEKSVKAGASYKQLNFINDKMKYDDKKLIINDKLKELNKKIEELSKDEASLIITALGRK